MGKRVLDRPQLRAELFPIWDAFWTLNASRPVIFGGVGPLPLVEIEAYLRMSDVQTPGTRMFWVKLLRAMDQVFLTKWYETHK